VVAHRLIVGFDYDALRDLRKRFANNLGVLGELTTNQDEDVTARGVYAQDVISFSEDLEMTLGARLDNVKYSVNDRTGQSASRSIHFKAFSPFAGINWSLHPSARLYANISRSFDPPATTDLANPEGPVGFNQNLDSQTATNYELGLKGLVIEKVRYELALFHIAVTDAIVPFELEGSGQTFYENAGKSTHQGIEASATVQLFPGLTGSVSYTWSDFTFDEFQAVDGESYNGNRIPGVPEHLLFAELKWAHDSGLFASLDMLYAGSFYADNGNSTQTESSTVTNFRAGLETRKGAWSFSPFIGVNNLLAEKYFSNVRLNASFGRYWEPAPVRNIYAGAQLGYHF
jgi:iron complex outermembrane receptor protein